MKTFIELAEDAAMEIKRDSKGDKEKEFIAWLHVALQREAMVTVAYQKERVKDQLDAWAKTYNVPNEVVDVLLRALVAVWARENGHREYFKAMLMAIDPPQSYIDEIEAMLENIQGRIEGAVISDAQSQTDRKRLQAKVAIIVGKMMGKVPQYVEGLHKASFSKYCSVNADLEYTAVAGYARMISIAREVPRASFMQDTPVIFDLRKTWIDETYHEALFRTLSEWPPDPPPPSTGPTHSPLGPAATSPQTMTVAAARDLILQAKTRAYRNDAETDGEKIIAVDYELIARDPVILHMKKAVHIVADEDEGNYMTAGA